MKIQSHLPHVYIYYKYTQLIIYKIKQQISVSNRKKLYFETYAIRIPLLGTNCMYYMHILQLRVLGYVRGMKGAVYKLKEKNKTKNLRFRLLHQ